MADSFLRIVFDRGAIFERNWDYVFLDFQSKISPGYTSVGASKSPFAHAKYDRVPSDL